MSVKCNCDNCKKEISLGSFGNIDTTQTDPMYCQSCFDATRTALDAIVREENEELKLQLKIYVNAVAAIVNKDRKTINMMVTALTKTKEADR